MCSKEWGRPSREQIWLLFIITAARHGDGGADLRSATMRANRLVIGALFSLLSCIARSPEPAWILIAERFWSPSPLATEVTFHNFARVASGWQLSGTQESFPNPGNDSTAVEPLCPPSTLPKLIYTDVPATVSNSECLPFSSANCKTDFSLTALISN